MSPQTAEVVIYTTGYCGFCHAAKRLLDARGVAYREISCDNRPDLRAWLRETSRQHTVPQVFINGDPIGGFMELNGLAMAGELDGRLGEAPAVDKPVLRS